MPEPITETMRASAGAVDPGTTVVTAELVPHIAVCICTYQRKHLLARLLAALQAQETEGLFTYSVIIVDNDEHRSAESVAIEWREKMSIDLRYCVEPRQNIALARNTAIRNAPGEFVAFIDDDEYPLNRWLVELLKTSREYEADAVLGPVMPEFEATPPAWIVKGKFFERSNHRTGERLAWNKCRSGNVLLRRRMLLAGETWFRPEFGTGGEDVDFFARMSQRGHSAVWCREAAVRETVPASRCSRKYLLGRALLRGCNSNRRQHDRLANAAKSVAALPCYIVLLPALALAGQHWFMRYLIKTCDHLSRLLAFLGINLISKREM